MEILQHLLELWEAAIGLPGSERLILEWSNPAPKKLLEVVTALLGEKGSPWSGGTPVPPGAVRSSYGSARREKAHLGGTGTAAPPGAVRSSHSSARRGKAHLLSGGSPVPPGAVRSSHSSARRGKAHLWVEVLQSLQELWEVVIVLPGRAGLTLEWRYSSPSRSCEK